ncbi:MAG: hypothetical protein M3Z64_01185 [Verrucomicrobiota bacterium]|nr:hypothetical protein [Verrucomicrobiota bacterium]
MPRLLALALSLLLICPSLRAADSDAERLERLEMKLNAGDKVFLLVNATNVSLARRT